MGRIDIPVGWFNYKKTTLKTENMDCPTGKFNQELI
jgi:hypothetical protein